MPYQFSNSQKNVCNNSTTPVAGGFNGQWNMKSAFPFSDNLEFRSQGNDIYIADFDNANKSTWTHLFIIGGWGNAETHVYANNDISTPICVVTTGVTNITEWTNFRVDYDEKNKNMKAYQNGKLLISCNDTNWKPANDKGRVFVYSQYSSNVRICQNVPIKHKQHKPRKHKAHVCKNNVAPLAGGFNGKWDMKSAFAFSDKLKFRSQGNDIYIADFDSASKSSWTHLFIIGGWSNSATHVYANNNIATPICSVNTGIANITEWTKFKVNYDEKNKNMKLYQNGKLLISCHDPNWKPANDKGRVFVYSQYSSNVKICKDKPKRKCHKRHHH